jgi:acetolactate synthase-1/3 small subunit
MEKFTVVLSVHNRYGVLNRITGVYARRGYNIDSLSMETSNAEVYRITITSAGDEYAQTQVTRQLAKLHDVVEVELT